MLNLATAAWKQMVAHAYDGLPDEACGLLAGRAGAAEVREFHPCANADASSRTYTIDPAEHLRIERVVEGRGLEVVGVMHSHTHTEAYPSPTDVAKAEYLDDWHFVIVSLRQPEPVLRSYRIVDGTVEEEPVVLVGR